jgi:hypothetical protein
MKKLKPVKYPVKVTEEELEEIKTVARDENNLMATVWAAMDYHRTRIHEVNQRKFAWWDKMKDKYGIDKEEPHTVHHKTGVITKVVGNRTRLDIGKQ